MWKASDALSAHAHCKARFADAIGASSYHAPFYCELAPDLACPLVCLLREHDGDPALEPELSAVHTAHAAMHCAMIELAQRRNGGEAIDVAASFGSHGVLGAASQVLIDSLYHLDHKMHQLED